MAGIDGSDSATDVNAKDASTSTLGHVPDQEEDEKERTIAKAALSIAELGLSPANLYMFSSSQSCILSGIT